MIHSGSSSEMAATLAGEHLASTSTLPRMRSGGRGIGCCCEENGRVLDSDVNFQHIEYPVSRSKQFVPGCSACRDSWDGQNGSESVQVQSEVRHSPGPGQEPYGGRNDSKHGCAYT